MVEHFILHGVCILPCSLITERYVYEMFHIMKGLCCNDNYCHRTFYIVKGSVRTLIYILHGVRDVNYLYVTRPHQQDYIFLLDCLQRDDFLNGSVTIE